MRQAVFSFSGKVTELRNRTANFAALPRPHPGGIMIMPQDFRDMVFCTHPKKFIKARHLSDGEGGTYKVLECRCGVEW